MFTALQRRHIDLEAGTVRIRQAFTEERGVGLVLGPPKSRASRRVVSIPSAVLPVVREHLAVHVADDPSAFAFTGPNGRPIWRGNFNKLVGWSTAVDKIGAPMLHFHDLRHTGNMIAAKTGASLRDLMARMGQDSPRAAMIYQHETAAADREIAAGISAQMEAAREGDCRSEQPRTATTDADGEHDAGPAPEQ